MKKQISLALALCVGCSFALEAQEPEQNVLDSWRSIRPMDAYDYCKTISGAPFAGRLTGDAGYTAAAGWAASKFKKWGLEPLGGKEGYLQAYPSPYTIVDEAEMTIIPSRGGEPAGGAAEEMKLKAGSDFLPLLFSASGDATGEIVFAGWGISAPALGYDDYEGVDVSGRFVLCFRGTPDRENEAFEEYDQHRHRMRTAKEKGALGVVYIYDKVNAHPNGDWIDGFFPAMISEAVADSLLAEKGLACAALKGRLAGTKKPESFALSSKIRHRVVSRHFPDGIGLNVVGILEGSDAALKHEFVLIGGHFDHCGTHLGMHFPGANDNASGSAVVMEIAEAYSKAAERPKRSIVFALFGGEEQGLIGSNIFAERFPPRLSKIDAMFNFDMVGEGDGAGCGYTPAAPGLLDTLEAADERVGTLRRTWKIEHVGVRSSDFAPFFQKGAACVACFSNGPHLAYHETGDTIYRINPDILADIARLGFLASYRWANR